jgi:hypothetical protein
LDEYLRHYADELAKHASAAPDNSSTWVPTGTSPMASLTAVQSSLQQIFPVAPYPDPSFAGGAAGFAQLGVYLSTLQQLVDNPPTLSQPASRAFAAAVLARLQSLHTEFSDGLTVAQLQSAVNQPIVLDEKWINKTWRQPLSQSIVNAKWPQQPRMALLTGLLLCQVAYNAAVLKDAKSDAEFRGAIATLASTEDLNAKTRADIVAMQRIPHASKGGQWEDINSAATRAVLDVVGEK